MTTGRCSSSERQSFRALVFSAGAPPLKLSSYPPWHLPDLAIEIRERSTILGFLAERCGKSGILRREVWRERAAAPPVAQNFEYLAGRSNRGQQIDPYPPIWAFERTRIDLREQPFRDGWVVFERPAVAFAR